MRRKKLSVRELARRAGISPSYMSRVLAGERTLPADEIIVNIASALELDADSLLVMAGRWPRYLEWLGRATTAGISAFKAASEAVREKYAGDGARVPNRARRVKR
jgi:transcriptional regulator with XRE-family HTH domain